MIFGIGGATMLPLHRAPFSPFIQRHFIHLVTVTFSVEFKRDQGVRHGLGYSTENVRAGVYDFGILRLFTGWLAGDLGGFGLGYSIGVLVGCFIDVLCPGQSHGRTDGI